MKAGNITAYQVKNKLGYSASFYHPKLKRRVTRGLGTANPAEAEIICRDLRTLCADQSLWSKTREELHAFDYRARDIFLGSIFLPTEGLELDAVKRGKPVTHIPKVKNVKDGLLEKVHAGYAAQSRFRSEFSDVYKAIVSIDPEAPTFMGLYWSHLENIFIQMERAKETETISSASAQCVLDELTEVMKLIASQIVKSWHESEQKRRELRVANELLAKQQTTASDTKPAKRNKSK